MVRFTAMDMAMMCMMDMGMMTMPKPLCASAKNLSCV